MADFPRIKWLNIDGQQVPFTEPQHFTGSGDETARTGHDNPLPTQVTGSMDGYTLPVKNQIITEIETVLDAVSVQSKNKTANVFINPKNATEIYLFISIDKKPWTIRYRNQFGLVRPENGYPVYFNADDTFSITSPAISFPVGYDGNRQGVKAPSNLKEAKDWGIPITDSEYFWVENNSDDLATITVKILRVWR